MSTRRVLTRTPVVVATGSEEQTLQVAADARTTKAEGEDATAKEASAEGAEVDTRDTAGEESGGATTTKE